MVGFGFLFSYVLSLLLILSGNHNHTDLLDAISTDVYWQLKHVAPELAQLEKDAGSDPAPASIDAIVKNLGSADFATRDKARQDLERMGPAILPLVRPLANSSDAEVAAVAEDLVKKFTEHAQERAIRRLMAIRTLGERKEKDSLPLLTSLKGSKELFVPEYAARALAQINGEKYMPADISGKLAADVGLLPADTAVVGQTSGLANQPLTIASVIEAATAKRTAEIANLPAGVLESPKPDAKQLILQTSQQLLSVLEHVGDIRIDAVTVGFNYTEEVVKAPPDAAATKPAGEAQPAADDAPPAGTTVEHGWFALIVRGQFDSAATLAAVKELAGDNAVFTPAEKPGDVAMIADKGGEATLLIPDNQQVILLTAPNKVESLAVREKFLAALKKGKGAFDENKDLAELMKSVDTKAPLWAVCKFTDVMTKEVLDGTIKTLVVNTKSLPNGDTDFTLKAQTVDADKAKATVDSLGGDLKTALEDVKREAKSNPTLAPVVSFMGSMKVSSDGASATLTGQLPEGIFNALISELPLMELLTPRTPPPVQPMPAQPVPEVVPPQPAPDPTPK